MFRRKHNDPEPLFRPRPQFYLDPRDAAGPDHQARRQALAAMRQLMSESPRLTKEILVERFLASHHSDASDATIKAIFGARGLLIAQDIRASVHESCVLEFAPPVEQELPF